jgi:hypothetical protein
MENQESNRRNFMKKAGLLVGGAIIATNSNASSLNEEEIKKLNPEQSEFMHRYGKWMDDFTEVIRLQKKSHTTMIIDLGWRCLHKKRMTLSLN